MRIRLPLDRLNLGPEGSSPSSQAHQSSACRVPGTQCGHITGLGLHMALAQSGAGHGQKNSCAGQQIWFAGVQQASPSFLSGQDLRWRSGDGQLGQRRNTSWHGQAFQPLSPEWRTRVRSSPAILGVPLMCGSGSWRCVVALSVKRVENSHRVYAKTW